MYRFTGVPDGANPLSGLTLLDGVFYGTTGEGGANRLGTAFSFHSASGIESPIHAFAGPEGGNPWGGLLAQGGLLYGAAQAGGANNYGTVYSIDPLSGASTVIYSFTGGADGAVPVTGLTYFNGSLYGVTPGNVNGVGAAPWGTVFSVDVASGAETTLYSFTNTGDGARPNGPLIVVNGFLYGSSYGSEAKKSKSLGSIFMIDPTTGAETTLFQFTSKRDGLYPSAGLTYYKGAFYGVTYLGGTADHGTLFKFTP